MQGSHAHRHTHTHHPQGAPWPWGQLQAGIRSRASGVNGPHDDPGAVGTESAVRAEVVLREGQGLQGWGRYQVAGHHCLGRSTTSNREHISLQPWEYRGAPARLLVPHPSTYCAPRYRICSLCLKWMGLRWTVTPKGTPNSKACHPK